MELKSKDTDRAEKNIRLTFTTHDRVWSNSVINISHSRQLRYISLVLRDLRETIAHRFVQEPIQIFQQAFLISNPNPSYCHLGTPLLSVPCIDGRCLVLLRNTIFILILIE